MPNNKKAIGLDFVIATSCDAPFLAAVDSAARAELMNRSTFIKRAIAKALRDHAGPQHASPALALSEAVA